MTAPPAVEWLTINEITAIFGISNRTVRRAVERGDLQPARTSPAPNAKMRFQRTAIEKWLRS